MGDEPSVGKVIRFVSSYLDARPDAVDSADGILRWWLRRQDINTTSETVQRALDVLVSSGVVERRTLPDGRNVYARARPVRAVRSSRDE